MRRVGPVDLCFHIRLKRRVFGLHIRELDRIAKALRLDLENGQPVDQLAREISMMIEAMAQPDREPGPREDGLKARDAQTSRGCGARLTVDIKRELP